MNLRRFPLMLMLCVAYGSAYGGCAHNASLEQYVNIVFCGASTQSPDNKLSIDQALLAARGKSSGIYIPPGTFITSGNHVPAPGIGIYGSGTLKLTAASRSPVVRLTDRDNSVVGVSFDLSANTGVSRVAIDIDGGSLRSLVSNVHSNFGRIVANVTNGRDPPTDIVIRDCNVVSAMVGGTGGGAIEVNSGTTHFSIMGNKINGNWLGGNPRQGAGDGAGIAIESGSRYGQVIGNDSHANTGDGIYILTGEFISVSDNNCSENRLSGIDVSSPLPKKTGNVVISGNICRSNLYDGIDINEGDTGVSFINIAVQGNHLEFNGPPPGGGGTGININYAANVALSANVVSNNAYAGILLLGCKNITVSGNLVLNNSRSPIGRQPGIRVDHTSHSIFTGNVITNRGGYPSQNYGVSETSSGSDYNIYTSNDVGENVDGALLVYGAHNTEIANLQVPRE